MQTHPSNTMKTMQSLRHSAESGTVKSSLQVFSTSSGSSLLFISTLWTSLALALTGQMLGLPLLALVAILSVPALVLIKMGWPNAAVAILIVTSFLNGPFSYIKVFGLNLKPENIGTVAVIAVLAFHVYEKRAHLGVSLSGFFLLAWVLITALSAANSPDPSRSLVLSLLILLSTLPFFLIVSIVKKYETFEFAFNLLLVVGVLEGIFGLLAWVIGHFVDNALWTFRYVDGYVNTRGTWPEMNIFADFLVVTAMLLVPHLIMRKVKWLAVVAFVTCILGILISKTRGAWLSLMASILLMPMILSQANFLNLPKIITKFFPIFIRASLLILPITVIILTATGTSHVLLDRVQTLYDLPSDPTFAARVNVDSTAWNAFWERGSIILGNGAKGFQLAQYDVLGIGDDWIGNIFLGALYDGGLLGLTMFALAVAVALWNGLTEARQITDVEHKAKLIAMVLACLAIVFTGQSNNHSWMAVVWVYFGLLVAGTNVAKEHSAYMSTEAG